VPFFTIESVIEGNVRERKAPKSNAGIAGEKGGARYFANYFDLYLFLLPALLYFIIFHYWPMYGALIAFKDFIPIKGILGSPWVGFAHFQRFFQSYFFSLLIRNTLLLSLFSIVLVFPAPIIFALMLNQVGAKRYRKIVQTASYIPHFISTVVFVGMIFIYLSPGVGFVNRLIRGLGGETVNFMGSAVWFRPVYILSDIWKSTGYGAIIYLAALAGINPELHEAAIVDGATKIQRIRHIDIPGITPTIVILLILRIGQVMNIGFQKAFLMQTALNMDASEIIPTYVYKQGLLGAQFSFASAVGLFNSVINLVLIIAVNQFARKVSDNSLW
jgi:putative aldouronate transport system permease protein